MSKKLKIAVLVSGSGSNLQVLIDQMQAGKLNVDIIGVISNVADAYAVTRAKNAGLRTVVLSHVPNGKRMGIKTFEKHTLELLSEWQPDVVVLAGFMRVLSAEFIAQVPCPMINLHPSLLPNYKGLDTHARVLAAGEAQHGCSVHVVTAELDAGQVLTQAVLAVRHHDTAQSLQQRVQKLEHQLVPFTLELMSKGVLDLNHLQQSANFVALPYRLWLD
ncbi:phosphoribosylglycinamide formyltransferase [Moraxella caviae]|uniref:Phosphoribosylglycinamide formyltransferase n=2 Tax=Moraxella caviae TaxID=34060 RepID=A0A1S9ZWE9_9GAMM|nr:phosphoribosylglycinamide formyltransferase [Moraxella caviae]STZ10164.1 Phosphoribosylglycinamide formyltransferase [Moraxella caviae]VEW13040.1 Phosphoribosylglycinamide formyltransferase [Moraxella caviae]